MLERRVIAQPVTAPLLLRQFEGFALNKNMAADCKLGLLTTEWHCACRSTRYHNCSRICFARNSHPVRYLVWLHSSAETTSIRKSYCSIKYWRVRSFMLTRRR